MDLLSVEDFVKGLEGASATNDWDVAVSYDEKKITELLEDLWKDKKTFGKVQLSVPVTREVWVLTRPREVTLNVKFTLSFSSPKLRFDPSNDGRAILSLMLGGIYEPENETLTYGLPLDCYQLEVNLPISAVYEKTPVGDATPSGTVINLSDSGDTSKTYIVLEFGAKGKGSTYTISALRALDETDGKGMDGVTIDALTDALAAHMSDFTKVSKLDFALAFVDASVAGKATKMQPESFVFTSVAGKDKTGYLSVYVQCKDSGNGPGALQPTFKLGQTKRVPIPIGYTSSIIISNRFFIKSYLIPQLKASGAKEVNDKSATKGIALEVKFDQNVMKKVDTNTYFSSDGINFDFMAHPLSFSISDATFSARWEYDQVLRWDAQGIPGPSGFRVGGSWGRVKLKITMQKDSQSIKTSNSKLTISGAVNNDDFKISTEAEHLGFGDLWSGGTNSLLKELKSENLHLDINQLSFECNDIDFFATSNILAPGKTLIDVDVANGLKTPFDIVILGNVHPKTDTTAHPAVRAMAMVRPLAAAGPTNGLADSVAQYAKFMTQIATAQPVAADFYKAVAAGSEADVRDALSRNGFSFDSMLEVCDLPGAAPPSMLAALEKAYPTSRALEMRIMAATVPSNYFDLRVFAGIYDTKYGNETGYLKVDPATLQIFVGVKSAENDPQKPPTWTRVDHTVKDGVVSWTTDGITSEITFTVDYSLEDGSPLPSTFSGTRGTDNDKAKYEGTQIVAKPDDPDWTAQHPALVTSFIATITGTVFGLGIPFAQWAIPAYKKKRQERAKKKIEEASKAASATAALLGQAPDDIEMSSLERRSQDTISREFSSIYNNDGSRASLRSSKGILTDKDLDYIAQTTAREIREEVHSLVDAKIRESIAALRPLMTVQDEASCVSAIFDQHVEPKIKECTDPEKLKVYVQEDCTVSFAEAELSHLATEKVDLQNEFTRLDQAIDITEKAVQTLEDDKAEAERKAEAAASAEDKAKHLKDSQDIAEKIHDLVESETFKQEKQDRQDATDDITENENKHTEMEHEKSEAEKRRDAAQHEAFKEHAHGV